MNDVLHVVGRMSKFERIATTAAIPVLSQEGLATFLILEAFDFIKNLISIF